MANRLDVTPFCPQPARSVLVKGATFEEYLVVGWPREDGCNVNCGVLHWAEAHFPAPEAHFPRP